MSSNLGDIQAAGSDTRPPMLDRTDYESWSQRIRLYCRGKENGLQILQSIDQGPYWIAFYLNTSLRFVSRPHCVLSQDLIAFCLKTSLRFASRPSCVLLQDFPGPFELGTTRNTLGTTPEGGVLLRPERPRTYDDLSDTKKKRYDADVRATNIVLQGLPKDIYKLINHNIEAKAIWDNVKMLLAGSELTKEDKESQLYNEFERFKMLPGENINEYYPLNLTKDKMPLMQGQENDVVLDEEELLFLAGEHANTFDADVDNQLVQDLALNEDNIFQADECDAFDSDVDDEPTAQSIFMANLSSAEPANLQAGPSNASILSEVHILENAIDHSVANQDEHEIHNEVQQVNVIDSTSDDIGNSNVIPYEQYLSVNNVYVVPSCASSVLNDACVLSDNDANVPHNPIATELNIYKEQVAIYEQRAKFELTEREHRMDDQMRMLIQNRNKTEENLKKELHSVKLQLNSTMENNKIIEETVTALKQEFKQKETKFLTDFSNLKNLRDKLENKLHLQDQSIQTVHMMLNPTKVYDQNTKIAIGAQNPLYLRQAKKAQSALYDGEELLKIHHAPVIVPSSEEDLELAEITRIKMHEKMNDSASVENRVSIIPPNYSKENFMATFTPQTQLTPEQVFWSLDLEKQKAKELKANAPPLPVLPPANVYPPNTPVHLVPRMLPTTSQVNIEHFDRVQKSLVTEVRAMKAVFENLEAEDVFYTVTDSTLTASQFHELSIAYNVAKTRARLTIQHLKDRTETSKSRTSKDAPKFDAFFELNEKDAQLQIHRNTIRKLKAQISQLKANKGDVTDTLLPQPLES
ncbi:hypothetical protein Tco_0970332 [Tanacetum coccineum]